MEFSTYYLYYFHYSGSLGYLIFCCHGVATKRKNYERIHVTPIIIL